LLVALDVADLEETEEGMRPALALCGEAAFQLVTKADIPGVCGPTAK
jgi:hypothetical protein